MLFTNAQPNHPYVRTISHIFTGSIGRRYTTFGIVKFSNLIEESSSKIISYSIIGTAVTLQIMKVPKAYFTGIFFNRTQRTRVTLYAKSYYLIMVVAALPWTRAYYP